MIGKQLTIFKELPILELEIDDYQPRIDYGSDSETEKLTCSIQQFGLQEPIMVTKKDDKRYVIIDGHRRYLCLQKLGIEKVMCHIYPELDDGELEIRRYEKQNNRKGWKPMEKSNSLNRAKVALGLKNEELAKLLNLSKTTIATSLQLRDQKLEYLELMQEYGLKEVYRTEFIRLRPKLRKIRNFEVPNIVRIIFEKIKHKVIRNAKDFRKIQKVFARAAANETEIHKFLSDPDATVSELDRDTIQSGFSLHILQLIEEMKQKRKTGIPFNEKEKGLITELKKLL
jgi:ParB/RepB/Spo0J family partition protein